MGETAVITVGLRLGSLFPTYSYNRTHAAVMAGGVLPHAHLKQWVAAWNAVAFRYDAMRAHDRAFRTSFRVHGAKPPDDERSAQERDLFGFFANASALFESVGYATFVFLSALGVDGFSLTTVAQQRGVKLSRLTNHGDTRGVPRSIAGGYEHLLQAAEYKEIKDIRDFLSHRTIPLRHFRFGPSGEQLAPGEWAMDLHGGRNVPITAQTTKMPLEWCSEALADLIRRVEGVVEQRPRVVPN